MARPPLANLFAVHDADPTVLNEIMRDLQRSKEFIEVWRPTPDWVAAIAPLPGGEPDGESCRHHQIVFAEGRDMLIERSGHASADERCREIVELAESCPDRLVSLPGDFGFICFRAKGSATVVRSCGGLVPFYLKQSGHRFAIATRIGDLVRYLPDPPHLDPLVNAIWARSWPMMPDGRTFLAGVSILGRGWFSRIEGGRQIKSGCYWNPRPKQIAYPSPALAREHVERLRTLLIEKLARDLDPDDGNLLSLSGGVDSSSLAALSAGLLKRKVWIWSLLPPREWKVGFQHTMSYIEPLVQQYRFERRWEVCDHEGLIFELWRAAPRSVFPILHPVLCSLPTVMREAPVRVLFGGEFADEVCGSVFTLPDWAEQTHLSRLLLDFWGLFKNPRMVARWAKYRMASLLKRQALPFPQDLLQNPNTKKHRDFFHPGVQTEYRSWCDRQRRAFAADSDPWRYLALRSTAHDGFVIMNWEACSALKIRRSLPFFNREVLELAFECHPVELYGPGTKKLLRAALQNDVPERNLQRLDKDHGRPPASAAHRYPLPEETLPEELVGVVSAEWLSQPPREGDDWLYGGLTRLLIFVESLRARRQERGGQ